jgi:phosphonate transport system substrate-binding protein
VAAGLMGWPRLCGAAQDGVLRVGFLRSVFPSVNLDDARIAMQLWAAELAEQMQQERRVEAELYKEASKLLDDATSGHVDVVTMTTTQLLHLGSLQPTMVGVYADGRATERYTLVVRGDSDSVTLAQLRNALCLVHRLGESDLPTLWLDVELGRGGLEPADRFLRLRSVDRPSQAVLPVFFGKADACVVTDRALETLFELNPQLRQELRVLKSSAEILPTVSAFGTSCSAADRRLIVDFSAAMHTHTQGRQILELFRMNRVVPFTNGLLDGVKELVDEHRRLAVE